jgi:hypothetical protein
MTSEDTISNLLSKLDVSNIYLYVGDAVRHDFLNKEVRSMGISLQTIASSTHSSKSFASIITGKYPPQHGVESFSNRLPKNMESILTLESFNTRLVDSIYEFLPDEYTEGTSPLNSTLRAGVPNVDEPFDSLEKPFVILERGPGGHAPYGDFNGDGAEYFSQVDRFTDVEQEYKRSITKDTNLFLQRYNTLSRRGLLDDTLVIYTSDHGELIGDRGLLGHNSPMCPELIYVPTVFIHPELQDLNSDEFSFHHTDLAPTICEILDQGDSLRTSASGGSILDKISKSPRPSYWSNNYFTSASSLSIGISYEGVWDSSGGYTFPTASQLTRIGVLIGKLARSSKRNYIRDNIFQGAKEYARGDYMFGDPNFTENKARKVLMEIRQKSIEGENMDLDEQTRDHLRSLGYME